MEFFQRFLKKLIQEDFSGFTNNDWFTLIFLFSVDSYCLFYAKHCFLKKQQHEFDFKRVNVKLLQYEIITSEIVKKKHLWMVVKSFFFVILMPTNKREKGDLHRASKAPVEMKLTFGKKININEVCYSLHCCNKYLYNVYQTLLMLI